MRRRRTIALVLLVAALMWACGVFLAWSVSKAAALVVPGTVSVVQYRTATISGSGTLACTLSGTVRAGDAVVAVMAAVGFGGGTVVTPAGNWTQMAFDMPDGLGGVGAFLAETGGGLAQPQTATFVATGDSGCAIAELSGVDGPATIGAASGVLNTSTGSTACPIDATYAVAPTSAVGAAELVVGFSEGATDAMTSVGYGVAHPIYDGSVSGAGAWSVGPVDASSGPATCVGADGGYVGALGGFELVALPTEATVAGVSTCIDTTGDSQPCDVLMQHDMERARAEFFMAAIIVCALSGCALAVGVMRR